MDALPVYLSGFLLFILFSCFIRIITTLSILRFGLGLNNSGFGIVVLALSLALSMLVMNSQLKSLGGIDALFNADRTKVAETLKPFMEQHSEPKIKERFGQLAEKLDAKVATDPAKPAAKDDGIPLVACSFLVSELHGAFQLGFMLLIPFLVIDIVISAILSLLGSVQISQEVLAVPLKILLFFAVDGWGLISEKLIKAYIA